MDRKIVFCDDFLKLHLRRYLLLTLLTSAVVIGMLSGCATIMNGDRQSISFETKPSEAKITIYDSHNMIVWSSKTPTTVSLKRGSGYFQG